MSIVVTTVRIILQAFIVVGAVVIVVAATGWLYPPIFPWGLALAGRMPMCTSDEVLRGAKTRYAVEQEVGQMGLRFVRAEPEGYELWTSTTGKYWTPRGHGGTLSYRLAQQKVDIYGWERGGIREGDVVVDCGAPVGVTALKAIELGASQVIVVEPEPKSLECLRRNLQEHIDAGRVILYPKPVWFPADRDGPAILLSRVDKMVEELKLDRVDVIKIEVKSSSLSVLEGAQETLSKHRPRIVISTEQNVDDELKVSQWLEASDYGYRIARGACSIGPDMQVLPDVVFYEPAVP